MIFICIVCKNHILIRNIYLPRMTLRVWSNTHTLFLLQVHDYLFRITYKICKSMCRTFCCFSWIFLEIFLHFLIKFSAELCKFTVFIITCAHNFYVTKIQHNLHFCWKFSTNHFKFPHDRPLFRPFSPFSFSQI